MKVKLYRLEKKTQVVYRSKVKDTLKKKFARIKGKGKGFSFFDKMK